MREVVVGSQPGLAILCPAEGNRMTNALTRQAQIDGVLLQLLQEIGIMTVAHKRATIRDRLGEDHRQGHETAVDPFPAVMASDHPESRELVAAALSLLPEG
jgi:hypothetical protein